MQKETSELVAAIVDQEKQSAATKPYTHLNTASDIDTSSDTDEEEEEYEKWKRRELERIKREEKMRDPTAAKDTTATPQATVSTLYNSVCLTFLLQSSDRIDLDLCSWFNNSLYHVRCCCDTTA
jgi:hypothetical protein